MINFLVHRKSHQYQQPTEDRIVLNTYDIIWRNPAHPAEHAQRLENVSREEIPTCACGEAVEEEAFTRDTAAITHSGVDLGVECVEEGAVDEVGGPDWKIGRQYVIMLEQWIGHILMEGG